jgi:hypothetical protein
VKLLEPPIDRYRVELEIQQVSGSQSAVPSLGFFANYAHSTRPDGWKEYALLSAAFTDLDRAPLGDPPKSSEVDLKSYCFVSTPGRLPNPNEFPAVERPLPLASLKMFPGPWRKLVIDASPERLLVKWYPTPGREEVLADLTAADLRDTRIRHDRVLIDAGKLTGHVYAPLPEWSPRRGIGFWVCDAAVAVRRFVVTPQ